MLEHQQSLSYEDEVTLFPQDPDAFCTAAAEEQGQLRSRLEKARELLKSVQVPDEVTPTHFAQSILQNLSQLFLHAQKYSICTTRGMLPLHAEVFFALKNMLPIFKRAKKSNF